ncbi:Cytoskeleton protein RodZ [Sinobacterium norvegicum]|uniref:Cytoskeleton protein RodZ n=1 Tax=Sinobacterium norvegicum TaxID=1641715 RepID=A0ABM9AHG1_9GAMM|nr:RodZ domain-containing protein [Sinobacterium norvegicum]CAH0992654.1 Cytoskeleton protein RodZ [Sinobacterium norvegicum]
MPEINNADQPIAENVHVGQLLSDARRAKGLSIEDVALHLCITQKNVAAIEIENYQAIGSSVFVLGYLKNYALLLGLDVDEVQRRYREQLPKKQEKRSITKPQLSIHKRHSGSPLWLLVVLSVCIGGAFWLFSGEPVSREVTTTNEVKVLTASGDTVVESLSQPVVVESEPALVTEVEPLVLDEQPLLTDDSGSEVVEQVLPDQRLSMYFDDECWVEVRDGSGKRLLSGIKKQGDQVEFDGIAPYQLVIGKVGAVRLTYNGENVEVVARSGKKTAKLTVGKAS